ncbi:MAG: inositol monophosphatase family protein [Planctomycetota bacterium]
MTARLDPTPILAELRSLQVSLRTALRDHMLAQSKDTWSRAERDDAGDTIFGIDVAVEDRLLEHCQRWGERQRFRLVAEGLDPRGLVFGREGQGQPPFVLIVDPIDGTRGLMFDKRSAFCLMAVAPERGPTTSLADIELAVMTELPTTRQVTSDVLFAVRGSGTQGERHDLRSGERTKLAVVPSSATTLRHGFATVASFFQGGKELTAQLDEAILLRALGPWNPDKAEVYSDQYICSGGQLAELALGRDRFVLDARPLVYHKLGVRSSLCCRPYDLCCALIAQEAGCVVTDPYGKPLDAPLDTTTNVAWVGFANAALAQRIGPIVKDEVTRLLS